MTDVNLMLGDCLDRMKDLDDNSVDSIVTDPPYGLSFMGKAWDKCVPSKEVWEEAFRVLKPGGHLLAFSGTRTQHRMAVNIEDAGFEIRDMIAWVYGSGFPKSHNISKSLDKMAGAEREVVGKYKYPDGSGDRKIIDSSESSDVYGGNRPGGSVNITAPTTDDAKKWDGWGTALKPALEPITVARKPLEENTVAKNVLKYGTGGINIDESRVPLNGDYKSKANGRPSQTGLADNYDPNTANLPDTVGRFPSNLIHDGSDEVTELFPYTKSGSLTADHRKNSGYAGENKNGIYGRGSERGGLDEYAANEGSAARFFYVPKTSKKDRNEGTDNNHPTVKPTDLMRYLVTMVTPKGGTTLDPFMGSGSTGRGAKLGGFNFIGIELDPDYLDIAKARIDAIEKESTLDEFFE